MSFTRSLIARRRDEEEGFTLIELMVVVLIIAILIAIAIPTFLGARKRAQDRAAQSNLRNALTAEKTVYTDNETFDNDLGNGVAAAPQNAMTSIEPSLQWKQAWPAAPTNHTIDVTVGDVGTQKYQVVCVHAQSKSGADFALGDIAVGNSAGTYYNKGTCSTAVATVSGWAQSW